ncbi:hypothetical protein PHLGIDRAFT_113286 [Phlebiopsis gigantea 11061_1 CR5-6]|uniref:RRM domain-containing protein n=1 Tax=Phlebiopsis gigantea (strain 11061_1 CR5-6) TaxID=745531 RepID=A0A0C3PX75_PHLG1|nr:hypothetical protein PHLGIDRAFT_113286 [Phlebiopsis gigantea 11061_1 CR5-6]
MPPASVYIGGIPDYITRTELHDHLSIYGKVNALNKQKGFSFVEFDLETDALDFVTQFSTRPFLGSECKIEIAKQPRRTSKVHETALPVSYASQSRPTHARVRYPVVVQNLNPQTCWQELKDFGRQLGGTVAFCDIDKHDRRQGFLEYYKQEDAESMVRELNGKDLLGHPVTLSSYGRKTLREDHIPSRSRSPTMKRDTRTWRSRSPLDDSRRHNTTRSSPTSPRRRGRPIKDARTSEPHERDSGYATRHEDRYVHFTKEQDSGRRAIPPRSRSPRKMADFNDELYFASDERKTRMQRIEQEWQAYNQSMPLSNTV